MTTRVIAMLDRAEGNESIGTMWTECDNQSAVAPDLRDMVATLADELEAERAKVAAARLEGWRAGREAAAKVAAASGYVKSALLTDGYGTMICQPVLGSAIAAHIRALPEPKEAEQ